MRHLLFLLPLMFLATPAAYGADTLKSKRFHFGTHPARTSISFVSDAELETIHGTTNQIGGSLVVDAAGETASGTLRIAVSSLDTGIAKRNEHLQGKTWLDAAKHRLISLKIINATQGKDGKWDYSGKLTIKGVTNDVKGTVRLTVFPKGTKGLGAGEWVRARTRFDVKLSHYGIKIPEMVGAKVSDVWKVSIDVFGTTAAPKKRS